MPPTLPKTPPIATRPAATAKLVTPSSPPTDGAHGSSAPVAASNAATRVRATPPTRVK